MKINLEKLYFFGYNSIVDFTFLLAINGLDESSATEVLLSFHPLDFQNVILCLVES